MLGLLDLQPSELLVTDAGLPLPQPVIAAGELLDTVARPLLRIIPAAATGHPLSSSLANRILHPPIHGSVVRALLDSTDETRSSHGVDTHGAMSLAEGRWDEFLLRRAQLLGSSTAGFVDRHAEWGARDRFLASSLLDNGAQSA